LKWKQVKFFFSPDMPRKISRKKMNTHTHKSSCVHMKIRKKEAHHIRRRPQLLSLFSCVSIDERGD
jgi:hypothetical protein